MRVLHVIPSVSPRRGGPSEVVLHMVTALRLRGVNAEIATTDEDIESPERLTGQLVEHGGVPVRFFARRFRRAPLLRDYAYSPVFSAWLARNLEHYDVLHVHALFSHLSTTAMRTARCAGTPYLSRPLGMLGRWPLRQSARRKRIYLRLVEEANLRGATALHFVSEAEQIEAADLGFPARTVVIPHGIALPQILPDPRNFLREQLDLPLDQKLVLFLGRIHEKKGLDLLVRALALWPQPRPVLLIAGAGPHRTEIERLARDLRMTPDIRWLGHADAPQKQLYLQGADLFALTSHHENFGVAVLEALAAGTPVLVSPQVALAGPIERHGLGLVVPLDIEAIRRGIARSLATPSGPDRATRRRFVQAEYSWPASAQALTLLYREIAKKIALALKCTAPYNIRALMKPLATYAPGRAELLGNHTDYNEGYVLAIAVDRGTTLTGTPREDRILSLHSREFADTVEISLDQLAAEKVASWARYTLGVVDVFRRQGLAVGGFSAEITSTLPMGAGLSSSASLENAAVLFLLKAFGGSLPPLQIAKFSQMAEHDFVGVRCGLLDQISSLMSHANHATFIDCRTFEVKHLPLSEKVSFVLAKSNARHALVDGEYNQRRDDCEAAARALGVKALRDATTQMLLDHRCEMPDRIYQRARHITGENERVLAGSEALQSGDLRKFGALMYESHESSQNFFENSCPELDVLVAAARKIPGVYGARLSGGGFGGATINLVEKGREEEVAAALTKSAPGTTCLITSAAAGALDTAMNSS